MNTIVIEYDDGTVATWFVPENQEDKEDKVQQVEDAIKKILGEPDSMKC